MTYFPNGTSFDVFYERWCSRCINWREDEECSGNWGCIVIDLHLQLNYDQCKETGTGKLYREVLEHFIPTKSDGFPDKCKMFLLKENADIPGQARMF